MVSGYAREADRRGVHLHQDTAVVGVDVADGRVRGGRTNRGSIAAPVVVNCTAGWSSQVCDLAGVALPLTTFPLQAP